MNILLFTNDDVRENVLKHVRGGSGLCYVPPYQIEVDRRENKSIGSNISKPRRGSCTSPLSSATKGSLTPPHHTYRSEAFAEDLVDELNWRTKI